MSAVRDKLARYTQNTQALNTVTCYQIYCTAALKGAHGCFSGNRLSALTMAVGAGKPRLFDRSCRFYSPAIRSVLFSSPSFCPLPNEQQKIESTNSKDVFIV